jgi:hypothetical protein
MTDARFPERWLNDRRVMQLSPGTFRAFVLTLTWSAANLTDGVVTEDDLALMPWLTPHAIGDLVKVDLWQFTGDHWLICDFVDTQTTSAELKAAALARRKARDKKRRQRAQAAAVPRDVPGDITRTGQARTGQARRSEGPGNAGELRAGDSLCGSEPVTAKTPARRGRTATADNGSGLPTPSQSLRDHDGSDNGGAGDQHFSAEVHRQSQATDRNAPARQS